MKRIRVIAACSEHIGKEGTLVENSIPDYYNSIVNVVFDDNPTRIETIPSSHIEFVNSEIELDPETTELNQTLNRRQYVCRDITDDGNDVVNAPKHYVTGKIECIDYILDKNLSYCLGNAVKYITRCEHKGKKVEDLEKAIWYINEEIRLTKALLKEKELSLTEKDS